MVELYLHSPYVFKTSCFVKHSDNLHVLTNFDVALVLTSSSISNSGSVLRKCVCFMQSRSRHQGHDAHLSCGWRGPPDMEC
jgi:hypothetical protein